MKRLLKNSKGFSLIELMIVVAIIGILAAIAVPNYQKFTRKAKQAEAKSLLSGYYTASKATMAEMGIHVGNFPIVGFKPEGELIYRLNVQDSGQAPPATFGNVLDIAACVDTQLAASLAACAGGGFTVSWQSHPASATNLSDRTAVSVANRNSFTAIAWSNLIGSNGAAAVAADEDVWTINDNKDIRLVQDGTDN